MKRHALFSLMGSQPGPVFNATQLLQWTDLFILYSEKFRDVAEEAKKNLEKVHSTSIIRLYPIDAFDMRSGIDAIVTAAAEVIREYKSEEAEYDIVINITGGTDVMTSAALLAGIMLDAKLYYIKTKRDEETNEYRDPEVIDIVPPKLLVDDIDERKYSVMRTISEHVGDISLADLAEEAGFNSSAAVKRHIDVLEEKGVVSSYREGKKRFLKLTNNGRMFLLLKSLE